MKLKFVLFYHSFCSCWNHGNAHFLRGIARELIRLGHEVVIHEPQDGWSRTHALNAGGERALAEAARLVPGVRTESYGPAGPDLDQALEGADAVLVHEWTAPELVEAIGRKRIRGGLFTLLFHDTHHRAISAATDIGQLDIEGYDGVLAFGEVLRELYVLRGWARRAYTWHEAADVELFHPIEAQKENDLVWIGNWGDGERTRELNDFLLKPAARLGLRTCVYGVRYPAPVLRKLAHLGIGYGGWLPNHHTPQVLARSRVTVHVPRRPYVNALPGIPTIRVFEALACGIPLVCSPWYDAERLFPPGSYLIASTSDEMARAIASVLEDAGLANDLAKTGLDAIRNRHSCAHRVFDLLSIIKRTKSSLEVAPQAATSSQRIPAP
jgi:spore maturation protein CgeB